MATQYDNLNELVNAAEHFRKDIESIGMSWETTTTMLGSIINRGVTWRQADTRKSNSRKRIVDHWGNDWRSKFPDKVNLPPLGVESEKSLEQLAAVAVLEPNLEEVGKLFENEIDGRKSRPKGLKPDDIIIKSEVERVKEQLLGKRRRAGQGAGRGGSPAIGEMEDIDTGDMTGQSSTHVKRKRGPFRRVVLRDVYVSVEEVEREITSMSEDPRETEVLRKCWKLLTKVDGNDSEEIGSGEIGSGEIGSGEIRSGEIGSGEIGLNRLIKIIRAREAALGRRRQGKKNASRRKEKRAKA